MRRHKIGVIGLTPAVMAIALGIALITNILARVGFNIQVIQLALSICAGFWLTGAYGSSLKERGLKCVLLSTLLILTLFVASTPVTYLLLSCFEQVERKPVL